MVATAKHLEIYLDKWVSATDRFVVGEEKGSCVWGGWVTNIETGKCAEHGDDDEEGDEFIVEYEMTSRPIFTACLVISIFHF